LPVLIPELKGFDNAVKIFYYTFNVYRSIAGSTGGGIKINLCIIIMMIYTVLASKEDVEIYQRRIPYDNIFKAVAIAVISLCWYSPAPFY
jgi:trk system potassium uptake protein TrkH